MATVFDNAISSGLKLRRSVAGRMVVYSDGVADGDVMAVRGQPNVKTTDALTVNITERYVDWLIDAEGLAGASATPLTLPPKPGHTITDNGDIYTVTNFEGTPPWAWVDSGETEYRIHTIKTGSVPNG